jgi:hypothetical protein
LLGKALTLLKIVEPAELILHDDRHGDHEGGDNPQSHKHFQFNSHRFDLPEGAATLTWYKKRIGGILPISQPNNPISGSEYPRFNKIIWKSKPACLNREEFSENPGLSIRRFTLRGSGASHETQGK